MLGDESIYVRHLRGRFPDPSTVPARGAKNKTREGATYEYVARSAGEAAQGQRFLETLPPLPGPAGTVILRRSRGPGSGAGGPSLPATTAEPKLHAQQHTVFFMFIS